MHQLIIVIMLHLLLCPVLVLKGCTQQPQSVEKQKTTIVFKYGRVLGDLEPIKRLIGEFEKQNPDIRVKDETLPAATDEQHQFYVINLEGKSSDFDVFALDVIWVQEFARAGWLRDLSRILPPESRKEFFQGPMTSVIYQNRVYAIPWYIDAGVLFYRKDLLEKYKFSPPKTWNELIHIASEIIREEPGLYGFIWQGKQYEGLVCNALEYIWSNGGDIIKDGDVVVDSYENRKALAFMTNLIYIYFITPEFVTTTVEDSARHIFGKGNAVFMRNWPYAWNLFERQESPIKGKVGVSALPSFPGHQSVSTLGGWQLGINKYSKHPKEAERFIEFFTSYEAQKTLSLSVGYKPTLRKLYKDEDLIRAQPFIASLYEVLERARPRPVTPFYMMISQVMQPEFSAALSRIKEPKEALKSARQQIEFILSAEE